MLWVGCVCAEKMTEDYVTPRRLENKLKCRAARKRLWMTKPWSLSKRNNLYKKIHGNCIVIFQAKDGDFSYVLNGEFCNKSFGTVELTKEASFDKYDVE